MQAEITPGDVLRLEGFALPPRTRFYYLKNGGVRLRAMVAFPPLKDPRGSVVFSPGRTEFIEKYFEVTEELQERGFTVLILDPRGQGLSERVCADPKKSYIDTFETYCDDLAFVTKVFAADLPLPHIVMGHSMGGTIGLQTILTGRLNPAAGIFSAPMLALHDLDTPLLPQLIRIFSKLGGCKCTIPFQGQRNEYPQVFRLNKLTSDPNRYQLWATYFENHKRLRIGAPTFGWICAAMKAMKFVNDNARHLNIPALFIAAGADPIVIPASVENFAQRAGAKCVNIAGALHEVLLEKDEYRDQFWAAFEAFLKKNAL